MHESMLCDSTVFYGTPFVAKLFSVMGDSYFKTNSVFLQNRLGFLHNQVGFFTEPTQFFELVFSLLTRCAPTAGYSFLQKDT